MGWLVSEMPDAIAQIFPRPKDVFESEYHAIYECVADGLQGLPDEEVFGMARGMLLQFRDWADALLGYLPNSEGQGTKVVIEVTGGRAEITHFAPGVEVEIIDHDNEALELVRCPRCEGEGMIRTPEGASDHGWEDDEGWVPCPRCGGQGIMSKADLREEHPELVAEAEVIAWA